MVKTTMPTMRLILASGLCAGLLVCSCGKTPEPPGRHAHTLGGTHHGAPLASPSSDTGILQDQKTYQPAAYSGGGGRGTGAPGSGTASGTDAATAARGLLINLLNDLEDGSVDYVLDAFDQGQIELLREDDDFLYDTQQAYESLTRALEVASGVSSVEQLNADLRKLVLDNRSVDPVSADTVTITPNPLLVVLGPEKTEPTMTVIRDGDDWKIRLDAPLTKDDVETIRAYHEKLQEAIYQLAEALEGGAVEGREAIFAALLQAGQGEEIDLPSPGGERPGLEETAEEEAGEEEAPEDGLP